jgi:hypothetical protein
MYCSHITVLRLVNDKHITSFTTIEQNTNGDGSIIKQTVLATTISGSGSGTILSVTIENGGQGYSAGDTLTIRKKNI